MKYTFTAETNKDISMDDDPANIIIKTLGRKG
jgi:hypothetical protein